MLEHVSRPAGPRNSAAMEQAANHAPPPKTPLWCKGPARLCCRMYASLHLGRSRLANACRRECQRAPGASRRPRWRLQESVLSPCAAFTHACRAIRSTLPVPDENPRHMACAAATRMNDRAWGPTLHSLDTAGERGGRRRCGCTSWRAGFLCHLFQYTNSQPGIPKPGERIRQEQAIVEC